MARTAGSADARFDAKLRRGIFGCLVWEGSIKTCGKPGYTKMYAQFYVHGVGPTNAHRFAYERARGPIPEGLVIDHLCRNSLCQQPWHMEAVTQGENARRGDPGKHNRIKTHCPQGHEYTPDNIYGRGDNKRTCRACQRERVAIRRYGQDLERAA